MGFETTYPANIEKCFYLPKTVVKKIEQGNEPGLPSEIQAERGFGE
jgi:hypothetical protein